MASISPALLQLEQRRYKNVRMPVLMRITFWLTRAFGVLKEVNFMGQVFL
jgi:hypothetical protein